MLLPKQALLQQQRRTSGSVRPSRVAPLTCAQCRSSYARCGATEPQQLPVQSDANISSRRHLLGSAVLGCAALAVAAPSPSEAITSNPFEYKQELKKRRRKIPESEFTDGPQGLKYYDLEVGGGPEATVGQRVAVHYEIKYRNITFMTSRVGMGVTGGNPLGFNVGEAQGDAGSTLAGLDLAVRGMRVGGLRRAIVPPELGYGSKGIGEIPPNSPLTIDVELLSIKTGPLGFRTKLVEG